MRRKAQSTVEFLLVFVAVILVLVAMLAPKEGPIRNGMRSFFSQLGSSIGGIMDEFK